jgi:hypothetical protein
MTLDEALHIVVARTGHARYRELCDPARPDSPAWRRIVLAMAGDESPKLPPIPDNPTPAPGVRLGGCCG